MIIGCLLRCTRTAAGTIGAYNGVKVGACMLLTKFRQNGYFFILFNNSPGHIEGNFIYPRVVGHSVGPPGIWGFAAVIVGGGFDGKCVGIGLT